MLYFSKPIINNCASKSTRRRNKTLNIKLKLRYIKDCNGIGGVEVKWYRTIDTSGYRDVRVSICQTINMAA